MCFKILHIHLCYKGECSLLKSPEEVNLVRDISNVYPVKGVYFGIKLHHQCLFLTKSQLKNHDTNVTYGKFFFSPESTEKESSCANSEKRNNLLEDLVFLLVLSFEE